MNLYFAPLEGVTVYPFRMAHRQLFTGVDRYYMPFISCHSSRSLKNKEKKDLMPEHNPGHASIPQLLTNSAEDVLSYIDIVSSYGYREVNLNLGCPSGTVVSKRKGAGFLGDPDALDAFFDQVFPSLDTAGIRLSVKTRIGMAGSEETGELIRIYNRYPISEIIVHPRYRQQFYRGTPDMEQFRNCYENLTAPVVYNGDINSKADADRLLSEYPDLHGLMLGRGLIANPALAREIRGGAALTTDEMHAFHDLVFRNWVDDLGDPNNVLHRMKELWDYLKWSFPDSEKQQKRIRRAKDAEAYLSAVDRLFAECPMKTL